LRRHKVTSIILLALFKSMVRCKERAFDYLWRAWIQLSYIAKWLKHYWQRFWVQQARHSQVLPYLLPNRFTLEYNIVMTLNKKRRTNELLVRNPFPSTQYLPLWFTSEWVATMLWKRQWFWFLDHYLYDSLSMGLKSPSESLVALKLDALQADNVVPSGLYIILQVE
jgi:hypothetical protein